MFYIFYSIYGGEWSDNGEHHEVTDPMGDVPGYSGVMPRADTCLSVEEVHLALLRGPLLCKETRKGG